MNENTKNEVRPFTLEEDATDFSAGILRYDLTSFAEPDPVDAASVTPKPKALRHRSRSSHKSSAAAAVATNPSQPLN